MQKLRPNQLLTLFWLRLVKMMLRLMEKLISWNKSGLMLLPLVKILKKPLMQLLQMQKQKLLLKRLKMRKLLLLQKKT